MPKEVLHCKCFAQNTIYNRSELLKHPVHVSLGICEEIFMIVHLNVEMVTYCTPTAVQSLMGTERVYRLVLLLLSLLVLVSCLWIIQVKMTD